MWERCQPKLSVGLNLKYASFILLFCPSCIFLLGLNGFEYCDGVTGVCSVGKCEGFLSCESVCVTGMQGFLAVT